MDAYKSLGPTGEGTYGVVIKALHVKTNQVVAIKKFKESDTDDQVRKTALREIRILKQLQHENIVCLYEVLRRKHRLYLVFEFVESTLLDAIEANPTGLDDEIVRRLMWQIVRGVDYLHSNQLIHRDIKPENLLLSKNGVLKICDFGFARPLAGPGANYTDYVSTRWYRCPELLIGDTEYGKPIDIWAIGCLMAEISTGNPLFPGETDLDQLNLIVECIGNLTPHMTAILRKNPIYKSAKLPTVTKPTGLASKLENLDPLALDVITRCLKYEPLQRITTSELLRHPYFSTIEESFLPIYKKALEMDSASSLLGKKLIQQTSTSASTAPSTVTPPSPTLGPSVPTTPTKEQSSPLRNDGSITSNSPSVSHSGVHNFSSSHLQSHSSSKDDDMSLNEKDLVSLPDSQHIAHPVHAPSVSQSIYPNASTASPSPVPTVQYSSSSMAHNAQATTLPYGTHSIQVSPTKGNSHSHSNFNPVDIGISAQGVGLNIHSNSSNGGVASSTSVPVTNSQPVGASTVSGASYSYQGSLGPTVVSLNRTSVAVTNSTSHATGSTQASGTLGRAFSLGQLLQVTSSSSYTSSSVNANSNPNSNLKSEKKKVTVVRDREREKDKDREKEKEREREKEGVLTRRSSLGSNSNTTATAAAANNNVNGSRERDRQTTNGTGTSHYAPSSKNGTLNASGTITLGKQAKTITGSMPSGALYSSMHQHQQQGKDRRLNDGSMNAVSQNYQVENSGMGGSDQFSSRFHTNGGGTGSDAEHTSSIWMEGDDPSIAAAVAASLNHSRHFSSGISSNDESLYYSAYSTHNPPHNNIANNSNINNNNTISSGYGTVHLNSNLSNLSNSTATAGSKTKGYSQLHASHQAYSHSHGLPSHSTTSVSNSTNMVNTSGALPSNTGGINSSNISGGYATLHANNQGAAVSQNTHTKDRSSQAGSRRHSIEMDDGTPIVVPNSGVYPDQFLESDSSASGFVSNPFSRHSSNNSNVTVSRSPQVQRRAPNGPYPIGVSSQPFSSQSFDEREYKESSLEQTNSGSLINSNGVSSSHGLYAGSSPIANPSTTSVNVNVNTNSNTLMNSRVTHPNHNLQNMTNLNSLALHSSSSSNYASNNTMINNTNVGGYADIAPSVSGVANGQSRSFVGLDGFGIDDTLGQMSSSFPMRDKHQMHIGPSMHHNHNLSHTHSLSHSHSVLGSSGNLSGSSHLHGNMMSDELDHIDVFRGEGTIKSRFHLPSNSSQANASVGLGPHNLSMGLNGFSSSLNQLQVGGRNAAQSREGREREKDRHSFQNRGAMAMGWSNPSNVSSNPAGSNDYQSIGISTASLHGVSVGSSGVGAVSVAREAKPQTRFERESRSIERERERDSLNLLPTASRIGITSELKERDKEDSGLGPSVSGIASSIREREREREKEERREKERERERDLLSMNVSVTTMGLRERADRSERDQQSFTSSGMNAISSSGLTSGNSRENITANTSRERQERERERMERMTLHSGGMGNPVSLRNTGGNKLDFSSNRRTVAGNGANAASSMSGYASGRDKQWQGLMGIPLRTGLR